MIKLDDSVSNYGVVLVSAGSRAEAEGLARTLVETQLAACVSITPIHSIYNWQGSIHSEDEWQLWIKTDLAKFEALEKKVRELHSYQVPEIIALPMAIASAPYLQWISDQVKI